MKVILKHKIEDDKLVFDMPTTQYKVKLMEILDRCNNKCGGYVSLNIERPYRKRTTGDNSQNNLFWKICTIIAQEVGDDSEGMKDTENGIKMRALSKGYPFHVSKITGEKIPESMTKINTVECSYLIDTAMQIASELGIVIDINSMRTEEKKESEFDQSVIDDFKNVDIF